MPTHSIQMVSLLEQTEHVVRYEQVPLGAGQQGTVHAIETIDGTLQPTFLLKLYSQTGSDELSQIEQNLRTLIAHFAAHAADADLWTNGLEALPRKLVRQRDGEQKLGVLVQRVAGEKLNSDTLRKQLGEAGLGVRLEVARQIATYTARLHRIGLVPADVTAPNLYVDLTVAPPQVYLIDVDGGGIVDGAGGYRTHPLVLGQTFDCWQPPEIYVGQKRECDEISDRWTVAVAVHACLFLYQRASTGQWIDVLPFWWEPAYADICDKPIAWPPDGAVAAQKPRAYPIYSDLLKRVGPDLAQRFKQAFDVESRVHAPQRRPTAADWAQVLFRAKRWLYACPCGQEFVAWEREVCPFCEAPLAHVQVMDAYGHHAMSRDWLINGKALGLADAGVCARLERHAHTLMLTGHHPLRVDGAAIEPEKPLHMEPGRGHWIEVLSPSGAIGHLSVMVPAGPGTQGVSARAGWIEPPGQPHHRSPAPDPLRPGAKQRPSAAAAVPPPPQTGDRVRAATARPMPQSSPARPAPPQTPIMPRPGPTIAKTPRTNARTPSQHGQAAAHQTGQRERRSLYLAPPTKPRLAELTAARLAILNHRLAQTRDIGTSFSPLHNVFTSQQWNELSRLKANEVLVRSGRPIDMNELRWSEQDYDRAVESLTAMFRIISRAADGLSCASCGIHGLFPAQLPADVRANMLMQCRQCGRIVCFGCARDGRCPDCQPRTGFFGRRRR